MRARLTVARLLQAWEDGWGLALSQRASMLLSAAYPDATTNSLATLSVGDRDRRLFALRAEAFGPDLTAIATCPACSTMIETQFDSRDVPSASETGTDPLELVHEGYIVQFRLPQAADLTELHKAATEVEARSLLLERCIQVASHDGRTINVDELPNDAIKSVVDAMAAADPAAEIELALTCTSCGHRWAPILDIAAFLWEEVNTWAARLLRDAHTLARAYGWSEPEILSLNPHRRQMYLELCHG